MINWVVTLLLTSPSLVKLPILNALSVAPGLPPLADGWGMGEGLCAGDGIRWAPGIGTGADGVGCGVLSKPNCMSLGAGALLL